MNRNFNPTTRVLASILLYEFSATTYDAILITIGDTYSGLWADKGMYCIAKAVHETRVKQCIP